MKKFSIFKNKWSKEPSGEITVRDAYELITLRSKLSEVTGSKIFAMDWWPQWVKNIRVDNDKSWKDKIPAFLFYGTTAVDSRKILAQHSGYYAIDIDVHPDDPGEDNAPVFDRLGFEGVKDMVSKQDSVVLCFMSPSGKGIKVIHRIAPHGIDLTDTRFVSHEIFNYFQTEYKKMDIYIDVQCKDWNRFCYFSYDRECYYNEGARAEDIFIQPPVVIYDGTKVERTPGTCGYILSNNARDKDQDCPFCNGGSKHDRQTFTYYVDDNGNRIGEYGICCRSKCAANVRPESTDDMKWYYLGKRIGTQQEVWLSKEEYKAKKALERLNKYK